MFAIDRASPLGIYIYYICVCVFSCDLSCLSQLLSHNRKHRRTYAVLSQHLSAPLLTSLRNMYIVFRHKCRIVQVCVCVMRESVRVSCVKKCQTKCYILTYYGNRRRISFSSGQDSTYDINISVNSSLNFSFATRLKILMNSSGQPFFKREHFVNYLSRYLSLILCPCRYTGFTRGGWFFYLQLNIDQLK